MLRCTVSVRSAHSQLSTWAAQVQAAEDAWNTRDPEAVSKAYTPDSRWRNRSEFFGGRQDIVAFLTRKWERELDYRLRKELWSFTDRKIAVRFQYEVGRGSRCHARAGARALLTARAAVQYHDAGGQWFRAYGNEMWLFDLDGYMQERRERPAAQRSLARDQSPTLSACKQAREHQRHPHPGVGAAVQMGAMTCVCEQAWSRLLLPYQQRTVASRWSTRAGCVKVLSACDQGMTIGRAVDVTFVVNDSSSVHCRSVGAV